VGWRLNCCWLSTMRPVGDNDSIWKNETQKERKTEITSSRCITCLRGEEMNDGRDCWGRAVMSVALHRGTLPSIRCFAFSCLSLIEEQVYTRHIWAATWTNIVVGESCLYMSYSRCVNHSVKPIKSLILSHLIDEPWLRQVSNRYRVVPSFMKWR